MMSQRKSIQTWGEMETEQEYSALGLVLIEKFE